MVVLFRIVFALFAGLFKPRIDLLGQATIHMRIWPNDLDLNVHANSGRYLSFMDVGRMELLVRMRLLRRVIRRGWRPVAGGAMISYRKSLLPFERFTIRSRVLCWDEKWFYFEHIIENASGDLASMATVRGLFVGREGTVSPSDFLKLAGRADLVSPAMPDYVARWREAEAAAR